MSITTILTTTLLYIPLAYLLLTILLYTAIFLPLQPRTTSSLSFAARTLAAYGTLSLCALYGVFASLILRLASNPRISQYATARSFHHLMYLTTLTRFDIIAGSHHLNAVRPAVIVGNHQSALDVLLLAAIWPRYCSVTAKSSLKYMPFLGWFMALSGTVFIDRGNRSSAIAAFDKAAEEVRRERQSVFIFPEGTRSNAPGPTMAGFKKGAFHLAIRAQVPVLPVVAANYWGVFSISERRFRAGRIPVRVLEPIETTGLGPEDVDALTERVREVMLKALVEVTESPLGRKATSVNVGDGEEDLARLVQEKTMPSKADGLDGAVASGAQR